MPIWRPQLHQYLGGTIRSLGAAIQIVGGVEDHVHLLIGLKATHAPADLVRELKKASSNWVSARYDPAFAWQEGYAIFTVSRTHLRHRYCRFASQAAGRISIFDTWFSLTPRFSGVYPVPNDS